MLGGISRFFVSGNGNIGINTTAPSSNLDVSNALPSTTTTIISLTTFSDTGFGPSFHGRKARGTQAAPTAVLQNDPLLMLIGRGYGTTAFASGGRVMINMRAAENWTDAAQGTTMSFQTTPLGSTATATRILIEPGGNVGIGGAGTTSPVTGALEVARSSGDTRSVLTSFGGEPEFRARFARGTSAAPTAAQEGDVLGEYAFAGYGATGFGAGNAGMAAVAAENWTDTARGTALGWYATSIGATDPDRFMFLLPSGNVGIGTPFGPGGEPTALDRLQVFGDVRVGTTGTNGCVKRFDGNGLAGTCVSDRRFKRDIAPFGSVLGSVAALQPVHYYWRAAEFPDRHFGDSRAYGLIAQDVERVLPDLVVTGDDGYKAVDYSKLPLLTIQAVKELKDENDALTQRVNALDRLLTENNARVAELERLMADLLAMAARR